MDNQQFRYGKPEDLAVIVQTAVDKKDHEKEVHWTIKVFGGALLSVTAVVLIGTFQTAFQGIGECQKNMVTKEEMNNRVKPIWENIKEFNAQKIEIAALRERIRLLEQQNRDLQIDMQKLRETKR